MYKIQAGSSGKERSMESAIIGMKTEFIPSYRFDNTDKQTAGHDVQVESAVQ